MEWNRKIPLASLMIAIFILSAISIAALTPTQVRADPPEGCPQGLTHLWNLDEIAAPCTVNYDDFVDGVDGVCSPNGGPTPAAGQVNGAQMFTRNDLGYGIDVPAAGSSFNWGASDLFSIELWIYRPIPPALDENDVAIGRDDDSTQLHWWIGVAAPGYEGVGLNAHSAAAVFVDKDSDNSDMVVLAGISSIADGRWYHIAVVRTSTHMLLYVNGVLEDMQPASFSSGFDSETALNIGWLSLSTQYDFDGGIDEVAMYNRDLSENEVKCHYTLGLFGKTVCESTLGLCDTCPEPPETLCDFIDPGTAGLSLFGTVRCEDPNVIVGETEEPEIWRGAAGTVPADWIDATAATGLWFLCVDGTLYWDHDDFEVDQTDGFTKQAGHEIMSGGPFVNAPVKYYEGQKIAPVYYKTVAGKANFFSTEGTPGTGDDVLIVASQLAWSEIGPRKDMFVIELFQKPGSDPPEYVVISYGYSGRGTLAASIWFKTVVEPKLSGFTDPYYIVLWEDDNLNGHPDVPGTDSYDVKYGTVPP